MSVAVPQPSECCSECPVPTVETTIPGPQGEPGENGTNGTDGINAFSSSTASFVQPAIAANVLVYVGDSTWAAIGQILFVKSAGYYEVISKPDGVSITLKNLGYDGSAAPTTIIPSSSQVSPAGIKGDEGTGSGDLLAANNLFDVASSATSRINLGVTATGADASYCKVANNLNDVTAATARTNLGLAIGTNVQAYDALLTSIAGLAAIADRIAYFSAVDTASLATFTAFARTLVDDATQAEALVTLGRVKERKGLLGYLTAANMNLAGDVLVPMTATRYRITAMVIENGAAGINLNTATAGLFSAAGGIGTIVADQSLAACTGANTFKETAVSGTGLTNVFTGANLYFRIGTPQGVAAVSNIWVFGEDYSP